MGKKNKVVKLTDRKIEGVGKVYNSYQFNLMFVNNSFCIRKYLTITNFT